MNNSQLQTILTYVKQKYLSSPEYLWQKSPTDFILRNPTSNKWYAVFMTISGAKLNLTDIQPIQIVNLRFDTHQALEFAQSTQNIYPAYHMNKNNWFSLILDKTTPDDFLLALVDKSYQFTST